MVLFRAINSMNGDLVTMVNQTMFTLVLNGTIAGNRTRNFSYCVIFLVLYEIHRNVIKGIDIIVTTNLSQKLQKKMFVEKAFSGMEEMCPKILGGYEY